MLRYLALILTIAGLAVALWLIGANGWAEVFRAVAVVGPGGLAALVAWQFLVFGLLGFCWWLVTPEVPPRAIASLVWARTVRDAASEVLPFSQVGGIVIGARAGVAAGVPPAPLYAGMIADQTTELAGQLLFTLFGVAVLLTRLDGHGAVLPPVLAGAAAMAGLMAAFAFAQQPMLRLAKALTGHVLPASLATFDAVRDRLVTVYRRRGRVVAAFLLHFIGWIGSGIAGWIALHAMGRPLPLIDVLTVEALIFALRTVAFMIPGGIGVQEAAYALLGPIFGLAAGPALALSIVKRARDVSFGIPVVVLWQLLEARALRRRGGAEAPPRAPI